MPWCVSGISRAGPVTVCGPPQDAFALSCTALFNAMRSWTRPRNRNRGSATTTATARTESKVLLQPDAAGAGEFELDIEEDHRKVRVFIPLHAKYEYQTALMRRNDEVVSAKARRVRAARSSHRQEEPAPIASARPGTDRRCTPHPRCGTWRRGWRTGSAYRPER